MLEDVELSYKEKYLKYKTKYLELKKQLGGFSNINGPTYFKKAAKASLLLSYSNSDYYKMKTNAKKSIYYIDLALKTNNDDIKEKLKIKSDAEYILKIAEYHLLKNRTLNILSTMKKTYSYDDALRTRTYARGARDLLSKLPHSDIKQNEWIILNKIITEANKIINK
jgi:hypothetical protein